MTDQAPDHLTITLAERVQGELDLVRTFRWARERLSRGKRMVLEIRTESRTLAQNRLMWSVLRDLSNQVLWWGKRLTAEGWKDFLTAHLSGQELVPNMDSTGFVAIGRGKSTSRMTIGEMVAVIELGHAFGADKGVVWSKTSLGGEGAAAPQRREKSRDEDRGEPRDMSKEAIHAVTQ